MWLTAQATKMVGRDEVGSAPNIGRQQWRRADPLARLALHAVAALGERDWQPETALVVATSFGAVTTTQRLVDSIAEHGDASASPAAFTASVHSSCAGVIGQALSIHGPSTTVTNGATGLSAALNWAHLMLNSKRSPTVLAVVGECHDEWSERVIGELAGLPWPMGSGCSALLLSSDGPGRPIQPGPGDTNLCLDSGGGTHADPALAALAQQCQRQRAADALGCWWPGCSVAVLGEYPQTLSLNEHGFDGSHQWTIGADTDSE